MSTKRQLFQAVLQGQATDRIPVGFWFHFFEDEVVEATGDTALIQKNITGHKQFIEAFQPDFIKLMSDGYFFYPNAKLTLEAADDVLLTVQSIGANHQWLDEQVALVKQQRQQFTEDVYSFYNVFSPITYLKIKFGGDAGFVKFVETHSEAAVKHVLAVVANDIAILARRVIEEAGADGIYYSTQSIQTPSKQADIFQKFVKPVDETVLTAAQAAGGTNILHICGYEGAKNQLADFADYPAEIINWAVVVEGVPLAEGAKIFKDKVVLGGFGNTVNDVLYAGNQAAIEAETQAIIASLTNGEKVLLGADCTIPRDTDLAHLDWVRERAIR